MRVAGEGVPRLPLVARVRVHPTIVPLRYGKTTVPVGVPDSRGVAASGVSVDVSVSPLGLRAARQNENLTPLLQERSPWIPLRAIVEIHTTEKPLPDSEALVFVVGVQCATVVGVPAGAVAHHSSVSALIAATASVP